MNYPFWEKLKVPNKPLTLPWDMKSPCPWEAWRNQAKKEYPVRYFLTETIPHFWGYTIRWNLRNWYYKIKDFLFPWNVIRISTLPRSWMDRDKVLLHASFQIFTDWVEREKPYEFTCSRSEYEEAYTFEGHVSSDRLEFYDAVHELYDWWKNYKSCWEMDTFDEEMMSYEKETEMLLKLVKNRAGLWT